MSKESDIKKRRTKALNTPSPMSADAVRDISGEFNAAVLADRLLNKLAGKNPSAK